MKKLTILFCLSLFAACHSDQKELRRALAAAGENRQQLEQVIEYYKHDEADSLKLRAAVYLIRYMPLHKSPASTPFLNTTYFRDGGRGSSAVLSAAL